VRGAECEVRVGAKVACQPVMGWRRFTEIRAWQLSLELERAFSAILARGPGRLDFRFCSDARDAAASAARNIAEGFARRSHREFLRYVTIAHGSQCETQTNLMVGRDRGYLTQAEFDRLLLMSEEMIATTVGLLKSLQRQVQQDG
jgi:four helix bundle protein